MRISPLLVGLLGALICTTGAMAAVNYTTEGGGYILESGTVDSNMTLTGAGFTTSVGSYKGDSEVTISEGVTLSTPNAMFIGGKGYGTTGTTGGNGTVVVGNGATLIVGAAQTNGAGAHLDVGNTGYKCTGTLTVDGGTVEAKGGLIVGRVGGGYGIVNISHGGQIIVDNTGVDAGTSHQIQVINGEINIEKGELTTGGDSAIFLGNEAGTKASLKVSEDGTLTAGTVYAGYAGSSTVTVDGGAMNVESLQLGGNGGSGVLDITNGAQVTIDELAAHGTNTKVQLSGAGSSLVTEAGVGIYGAELDISDDAVWTANSDVVVDKDAKVVFLATHASADTGHVVLGNNVNFQLDSENVVVDLDPSVLKSIENGQLKLTLIDAGANGSDVSGAAANDDFEVEVRENHQIYDGDYEVKLDDSDGGIKLYIEGAVDEAAVAALMGEGGTEVANTMWSSATVMQSYTGAVMNQLRLPRTQDDRVWGAALGTFADYDSEGTKTGFRYNGGGAVVGYDRNLTQNVILGASVGNVYGRHEAKDTYFKARQNETMLSLYGRYTKVMRKTYNRFNVDGYVAYGNVRSEADAAMYGSLSHVGSAEWTEHVFGAGVFFSFDMLMGETRTLTAWTGITCLYGKQNDVNFSDGDLTQSFRDGELSQWTIPVGLTYTETVSLGNGQYLIPQLTVAALFDVERTNPSFTTEFDGATSTVEGLSPDRVGGMLEAGATWVINSRWSTGLYYTLEHRGGNTNQGARLHVGYSF